MAVSSDLKQRIESAMVVVEPSDSWFNSRLRDKALWALTAAQEAANMGLNSQAWAQLKYVWSLQDQDAWEGFPSKVERVGLRATPLSVRDRQVDWTLQWDEPKKKPNFFERLFNDTTVCHWIICDRMQLNSSSYRAPLEVLNLVPALRTLVKDSQIAIFVEKSKVDPALAVEVGSGWYLIARWE